MNKPILRTSGNSVLSFSTVLVITFVLILLGMVTIILLVGNDTRQHFREQITVQLILHEKADEKEVAAFKRELEGEDYTGEVTLVSSAKAAEIMKAELGEDFVSFLGYNPLPASIDIKLNPRFAGLDTLERITATLEKNPLVHEVVFPKVLAQEINRNMKALTLAGMIVTTVFMVVAVMLIVVTVWLAIFSQRFVIRSMQLVGATFWFIQKPFLMRGAWYGLLSSIMALAILSLLVYGYADELGRPDLIVFDPRNFAILSAVVVATGILVSLLSTALAVRRFVRLSHDKLY